MAYNYISKQVKSITFGLFSPKDVKKMAVAKVVTAELYDKEGYPVDGGLMDIRLGVIDPGFRCKTCGSKLKECNGHFGYIELARPIVHIEYVAKILDALRGTCSECGKALIAENLIQSHKDHLESLGKNLDIKKEYIRKIRDSMKKIKKCMHCKAKQYTTKLEKPSTFVENDRRLDPIEVRTRLERIPDDHVVFLGLNPEFARPEWVVLTLLLIPPVTMRPSITLESGERSEDDLTHKLGDIVRINQRLFENINAGAPEVIVEDLWDLLQYHVTTYFNNDIAQVPPARHRSGQSLKTLEERIKRKEGRFRHNLAGKRVNFSARTVISPDPKIKPDEVGIPIIVAMELTIPERVTEWNIEKMKELISRGSENYPGANYVIRADGKKKKITEQTKEQLLEELMPGFVVERHLVDGDISIFNRQPSLHRMSIMCHRVKVLPGKSFRLNPSVCIAPDTLVQLSSGIQRPIDELKNCWKESELATFDRKEGKLFPTELKKFWGLKPEEYGAKCYEIKTKSGRKVVATGDHPFYTSSGIKKAKDLKINDKAIVRPLETPVYKDVDKVILSEEDIKKISPKKTYLKHSIKILKDLKLIPLNLNDQRIMILSRLIGHLFGDGTFILKEDKARLIFRGTKEDLDIIQKDIRSLGFTPEKIYVKTTGGIIYTVKGKKLKVIGSYPYFEIRNKPLALLFAALGAPNGDKVKIKDYSIPRWIKNSPLHIKREFVGSYFGCELSRPSIRKNSKSSFRSLVFKLSKIKKSKKGGYNFIKDLERILDKFDVKISNIREEESNIRKDGEMTYSLVSTIDSQKSILNFFSKIGYVYSKEKDNIARLAYSYILSKNNKIRERKEKRRQFFEFRNEGYNFKEISKKLNISLGTLEHWAYHYNTASLPMDFPDFKTWVADNSAGPGIVYEPISEVKETYCPFVYDITTIADTHNFFANGFLTKNCTPYNADFDGDEMNLHIPQNEEARAEAEILMEARSQIITPKSGFNVISAIQDSVSGLYLLTKEMEFSKEEAADILVSVGINDIGPLKNKMSGKEVFSVLLPKDFSFIGTSRDGNQVVIKDGKLIEGLIDVNSVGEGSGDLIRDLYSQYGPERAISLLADISRLGIEILLRRGFTTSISDTDLPAKAHEEIGRLIKSAESRVFELIKTFEEKKLEAFPGRTVEETLELKILETLNKVRDSIGKIVEENSDEQNHTLIMARSGARGKILNLTMMAACAGQQSLRGKRIEVGYIGRTLSLFKREDLSPEARGFIKRGFKEGLTPSEFFFAAMTGRDSLMDTALRTPKSGYLYRRLSNALQDLRIEYDHTVRDANENIIQFSYGDDGIDVSKSHGGTINVKKIVKEVKGGLHG